MADITKCKDEDCPVKNKCYRYTADADELCQSYFIETPSKIVDGKFTCDAYWGNNAKAIWNQLKDITKENE